MKRTTSKTIQSEPCACCRAPTPVTEPGWVILADKRLICAECYEAGLHRKKPMATTEERQAQLEL